MRCDSEEGAYQLGRLLVSLGHQKFAIVAGPLGVSTSEDRVAGFRRALAEAGFATDIPVLHGHLTQESGHAMTCRVVSATPRPTAVFATNNFLAIGALHALHEMGVRVPEDVALVGFDDLPPDLVTFPFLTVAAQPAYEMGRKAVELLLERLDGKSEQPFQEVLLISELIIRRSSGDARDG